MKHPTRNSVLLVTALLIAAGCSTEETPSLSYESTTFSGDQTSQTRRPTVSGGIASSFSYSGTLPPGVSFDTSTGVFTGPSTLNFQATQIAAGGEHTCVVTSSGGAKCWGSNEYGQLGDGTTVDRSTPVEVVGLESDVAQIVAGWLYTCAVTVDDGAKCWGRGMEPWNSTPAIVPNAGPNPGWPSTVTVTVTLLSGETATANVTLADR